MEKQQLKIQENMMKYQVETMATNNKKLIRLSQLIGMDSRNDQLCQQRIFNILLNEELSDKDIKRAQHLLFRIGQNLNEKYKNIELKDNHDIKFYKEVKEGDTDEFGEQ